MLRSSFTPQTLGFLKSSHIPKASVWKFNKAAQTNVLPSFLQNCVQSKVTYTQFTTLQSSRSPKVKTSLVSFHVYKLASLPKTGLAPANLHALISKRNNSTSSNDVQYIEGEKRDVLVVVWLFGVALLIFAIIVIGGITRLTESGLSMTDWKFHGNLPPMNEQEWQEEFEKYRQFPEFKRLNPRMTVDEFKNIYFWEYLHRMWGRMIGVYFAVPYIYFLLRGRLPKSLNLKCAGILLGIGAQGLVGWWMVKSGLEEPTHDQHIPRVSQYRLATHLSAAFLLYIGSLWTAIDLYTKPYRPTHPAIYNSRNSHIMVVRDHEMLQAASILKKTRTFSLATSSLVLLTAISGAFVAGLDAGLVYNTFPYMGDGIIPEESWNASEIPMIPISPLSSEQFTPEQIYSAQRKVWLRENLFEKSESVQFNHRVLGITTAGVVSSLYLYSKKLLPYYSQATKFARHMIFGTVVAQVTLGITTLLYFVPVHLAAAHQAGSVVLLSSNLWFLNQLKKLRI